MAMNTKELRRLRQVHQYSFLRNEPVSGITRNTVQATKRSTPDTAMTAFTQLLAWRLNAPRALISLVDRKDQYTIQAPVQPPSYPFFCVTDLANHPQFKNLPYVRGPPYVRFYGGTPLIVKDGSRIGSLFVLDVKPRYGGLSQAEVYILGTMASNVMTYMEMQRASKERDRITVMSKGLATFTEGRHRIPSAWLTANGALTGTSEAHAKEIDRRPPEDNANKKANVETISGRDAEDLVNNTAEGNTHEKILWSEKGKINQRPADILSFSTKELSASGQHSPSLAEFKAVPRHFVKYLIQKYNKGRLWSLDENGTPIDDENLAQFDSGSSDVELRMKTAEFASLAAYFPQARQIIYVPVFDHATSSCICACFAVSLREVPIFTDAIEVPFARAFCNSVSVEWDRVSVELANRQKGDFLSSISHTIQSLKINEFHQRIPAEMASKPSLSQDLASIVNPRGFVSSLGLNSEVDVTVICEMVVDAVWAGHLYDQRLAAAHVLSQPVADNNTGAIIRSPTASLHSYPVEVIMEILPGEWKFNCTPGAIQRILMNLMGNSLKFTKAGYIRVQLGTQEDIPSAQTALIDDGEKRTSLVTIKVTDTGCGISEDFLKTKLYTPFSQESALDAGTGLGLSMTQKLVQALDGVITIQSEVCRGTEVCVRIPLISATDRTPDTATNDGIPSLQSDITGSVSALRSQCLNRTVALYGFDSPSLKLLGQSINLYVSEWYNLQTTQVLSQADFVIVDESVLDNMIKHISDPSVLSQTVVLRNTRTKDPKLQMATYDAVKPVGPHGLAKVLLRCWTQNHISMKDSITQSITTNSSKSIMKDSTTNSVKKPAKTIAKHPLKNNMTAIENPRGNTSGTTRCIDMADQNGNADQDGEPSSRHTLKERTSMTRVLSIHEQYQDTLAKPAQPYILCVDDNRLNLKILQAFLQKLNYRNIKCAENGLEALKMVESTPLETGFDLIFMDLSMPICDGFESAERIRKFERSRKDIHSPNTESKSSFIIALTGQASIRDQTQALAAGMDRFVTKPMSLGYLQRLLEELSRHLKIAGPNP
ncbi:hypothetical protein B7494_g1906 [Chlorociboria aeruginascens]|nr:hypothetical protein B7494_g1906 [Chlorociboria aeruginascens]